MSLLALAALLVVAVVIVGTTVTTIRAVRLFRTFRRFGEALGSGSTRIDRAVWDLERGAARFPTHVERLAHAQAQLARSVGELAVVTRASRRERARALRLRAALPRK